MDTTRAVSADRLRFVKSVESLVHTVQVRARSTQRVSCFDELKTAVWCRRPSFNAGLERPSPSDKRPKA